MMVEKHVVGCFLVVILLGPKLLKPGDTVMFVAPAGPPERPQVMLAKRRIEERGYRVKMRDDIFAVEGYLAGTDERRADEMMEAFADPEVDAVLCVRGGYGVMRILDRLDYALIRQNPKAVLGFSDVTALHAALNRKAGLVSFHGPGPASGLGAEDQPSDFTVRWLIQAIEQSGSGGSDGYTIDVPAAVANVDSFGKGKARGRLVGGNLSLISALEGTPYAIDAEDAILLIEDVNEAPYRIDRMLQQLKLAGKLGQIKGAVLGLFTTEYVREDKLTDDVRFDTQGVLRQYFESAGVPVLVNYPIGHHRQNCTVPLGAQVEVDADAKTLRILRMRLRIGH
ncbi:MAG: LD-carboxypeptidase [Planctomycetota bacterium]|nr:MAG: LD-carboxypeptidase [Planctomycetota bacterium]